MIIKTLVTQMQKKKRLMQAYEDATDKPYSYIFIDLHQKTSKFIHIKTNIL